MPSAACRPAGSRAGGAVPDLALLQLLPVRHLGNAALLRHETELLQLLLEDVADLQPGLRIELAPPQLGREDFVDVPPHLIDRGALHLGIGLAEELPGGEIQEGGEIEDVPDLELRLPGEEEPQPAVPHPESALDLALGPAGTRDELGQELQQARRFLFVHAG